MSLQPHVGRCFSERSEMQDPVCTVRPRVAMEPSKWGWSRGGTNADFTQEPSPRPLFAPPPPLPDTAVGLSKRHFAST